jgi:hypothetical protein
LQAVLGLPFSALNEDFNLNLGAQRPLKLTCLVQPRCTRQFFHTVNQRGKPGKLDFIVIEFDTRIFSKLPMPFISLKET